MKKEDLFEAIGEIDGQSVQRAENYRAARKPAWVRWAALAACIALLVGAFAAVPLLKNGTGGFGFGVTAVRANYPKSAVKKMSPQKFMDGSAYWTWLVDYEKKTSVSSELQAGMDGYYAAIMKQLLPSEDENTVCSPLNTYIAVAMLAEITGGNTRQQILDVLDVPDVDTLRKNVHALWEGNYAETPVLTSLLANSIWLNKDVPYKDETLNTLAEQYYASSFCGRPGSEAMDKALQTWTDKNTGGLLNEYTKDMQLDPGTVLALVSTIYYKAMWVNDFSLNATKQKTFHGTKGDTIVDMMYQSDDMGVCRTDAFTAVGLSLNDSGYMYFYLPNEGTDVNALSSDPDVFRVLQRDGEGWFWPIVHMSVPRFHISEKTDLLETMRALGVTDALDPHVSDFTSLTEGADQIIVSAAEHTAMVEIDEQGVKGAAYTEVDIYPTAAAEEEEEEIDFVLDRPFMFVITGADGSILFSGVVRNIE